MKLSEAHVAVVRAMLLGDEEEYERLKEQFQPEGERFERPAEILLSAVFEQAVRRRFGPETTRADIIRYVAEARGRAPLKYEQLNVKLAERLLLAFLTADQPALHGLNPEEVSAVMGPLLIDLLPLPPDVQVIDELLAAATTRTTAAMRSLPN